MGVGIMNTVKMKFLKDTDKVKKGEILNVSTKGDHHLAYVKCGIAKIIEEEKTIKEVTKKKKETKKPIEKKQEQTKKKNIPEKKESMPSITTKTIKEPIINGDTPKWLIIQKKQQHNTDTTIKDILTKQATPQTTTTFTIQEENLWQCNKCKQQQQSPETPLNCISCDFKNTTFKKISNTVNTKRWKLTQWKDIPIEEIDMKEVYKKLKDLLKKCIIFPEELEYDFLTLWIMASYKRESFDSISFLMFQGLIESGKTRGLDILRELGYQMIHTTGVTFPCMCRYTDNYHAGILIDEIDNKIDTRTESGRQYLDFLKPSYRRGSVYATAHREDQDDTKEYENYGFKAFAGENGGRDLALRSRCIVFKMEQAYPKIPELRYIEDELNEMRNILLNYRYKFDDPKPLPFEFPLQGRDRELFSCIIQTAIHIGLDYEHVIKFITKRKEEKIETLRETDEYYILKTIYKISTNETLFDAPEFISYSDISKELGWDEDSEVSKKKRQRIGYILKKFQLKTKRYGTGNVLLLSDDYNSDRLSHLYKRFYVT
jgi:rubrerythrin